jgi:glycine/D-amino acid oxidase-like deaminating enzyme
MENVLVASDALRKLHAGGLERYRELLGSEIYFDLIRGAGQIYVWEGVEEGASERISRELWKRHGIKAETLDVAELRQMVPEISPDITRAVFMPNNGHTTNPLRLVESIGGLLRAAGGAVVQESVLKIIPEGSAYRLVTNKGDHRFDKVVVAAGAWSKSLLAPLGAHLPLETERGYHVMLPKPNFELKVPILHKSRGFGATPMEEGLRFAGTVEIAGLDQPMNEARARTILEQAKRLFPRLEPGEAKMWMGFRPSLPDSVPVIDRVPAHPGVLIACGHGHTGMTAGASTGRLVAELVMGRPPSLDAAPYRLARFH